MNAIILAAGMGTRLRPLTNDNPKCLVPVNGIPIVERQLDYLHEAGIKDITLVSGYKAEKLDYLVEKYGVKIVFNEKFDTCNNIYSLYKVLDRFGDTWVIEGDVFMTANCFTLDIHHSTYFAKWHEHFENEWGLIPDDNNKLQKIIIGTGQGYVMSGISYWTKMDAIVIEETLKSVIGKGGYEKLFWDNIVLDILYKLNISLCRNDKMREIDTVEDLLAI